MKVHVTCPVCARAITEAIKANAQPDLSDFGFLAGDLIDSGLVLVHCSRGHEAAVVYNHRKHEILFWSAAAALDDGYTNEAVSTFAAALERLYEFYVRVVWRKSGTDAGLVDRAWKAMAAQSERQFGAFCSLWLLETGSAFSLPDFVPEFRNRVIHRGYIPRLEEVESFAGEVFSIVRRVMSELRSTSSEAIEEQMRIQTQRQHASIPQGMDRLSMARVNMDEGDASQNFAAWFREFRDQRRRERASFQKGAA